MNKIYKDADPSRSSRPPRLPITVNLLTRMLKANDRSLPAKMFGAAWSVGIYGLFRAGEITVKGRPGSRRYRILRRSDVTWFNDRVEIFLRASKTDYLRRGVTIKLFRNDTSSCPYSLLKSAWDNALNRSSAAALFQDLRGNPMTYTALLRSIKIAIQRLQLDAANYGGHSLRAGGATSLALCGYPDSMIKILGRWKSLAYQRYIKLDPHTFHDVSNDMATQAAKPSLFGGLDGPQALDGLLKVSLRFSD
jgi:hypothetical protein